MSYSHLSVVCLTLFLGLLKMNEQFATALECYQTAKVCDGQKCLNEKPGPETMSNCRIPLTEVLGEVIGRRKIEIRKDSQTKYLEDDDPDSLNKGINDLGFDVPWLSKLVEGYDANATGVCYMFQMVYTVKATGGTLQKTFLYRGCVMDNVGHCEDITQTSPHTKKISATIKYCTTEGNMSNIDSANLDPAKLPSPNSGFYLKPSGIFGLVLLTLVSYLQTDIRFA